MVAKSGDGAARTLAATNRKAQHLYSFERTLEAGLILLGSEVKSVRAGGASIAEAHVSFDGGEAWLVNAHIASYKQATRFNHEERRARKLLLNRREIHRLAGGVARRGMTVVPLALYFNDRGKLKLEIALARGKKLHDRRETEKKRDWERQKARIERQFTR